MKNLFETVSELLRHDKRFFSQDGTLMRNAVYEAAMGMDGGLLKLLMSDPEVKKQFFTDVDGTLVFDKAGFGRLINNRQFLQGSYTRYRNKIGLADTDGSLISASGEVELVFPYKDCVLKGGQSREDQKRSEIFYNETLTPEMVDVLLAPKVFTGAIRFSEKGEEAVSKFDKNDNLLIKGNNLLVISSLLERYKGAVKLIYIDPPYNTGNDGFGYNDRFSRSSWLTFLKNRLEIARKLLAEDGALYIQLDYNNVHYAKVLLDEIFGENNFQREIIWRIGWISGYKTAANNYIRNHDTILFYSRDHKKINFNKQYIKNSDYKKLISLSDMKKCLEDCGMDTGKSKEITELINHTNRPERYPIEDVWNCNEYDDLNSIAITSFSGESVSKMLKGDDLKGQKPEKLLKRIIESHTAEGDLVLDFFGGTGTTAAAAHKMGRRYIVVEQMDYAKDFIVERLKKVISGERSGISRTENWYGEGSFVYFEMASLNQAFADRIRDAKECRELEEIWRDVQKSGFISSLADPGEIDMQAEDFLELSLFEKKRLLMELLDKNMLYVNLTDIDDMELNISDVDKAFTRSFYEVK